MHTCTQTRAYTHLTGCLVTQITCSLATIVATNLHTHILRRLQGTNLHVYLVNTKYKEMQLL